MAQTRQARDLRARELEAQRELRALRAAMRLMGLDPDSVAAFVGDVEEVSAQRALLLSCVRLDEKALRSRGAKNLDGWRAVWERLQLPAPAPLC